MKKPETIQRILILATYFPSPDYPSRGNWALEQALALAKQVERVEVVVPTPYVPRWAGLFHRTLRYYSRTPKTHHYGSLKIHYPRWLSYPWSIFNRFNRKFPTVVIKVGWFFFQYGLCRYIREFNPDAIIAHHTLVSGQLAHRLKLRFGIPYVVVDHETYDIKTGSENPAVKAVFQRVASDASAMIVVSRKMESLARGVYPEIPFRTVYNGSSFTPWYRDDYNPENQDLTVFCCAKFYRRKAIDLLMQAFDELLGKGYRASLRFAGEGPDLKLITAVRDKLEARQAITLLGLIDSENVAEEMRKADIFALVGWGEPFGVVFLEAMAAGLPIVISEDAGAAEILKDGESAILVRPRNKRAVCLALERLLQSPALREKLGRNAQRIYEQGFRWEIINQQYLRFFSKPITGPEQGNK